MRLNRISEKQQKKRCRSGPKVVFVCVHSCNGQFGKNNFISASFETFQIESFSKWIAKEAYMSFAKRGFSSFNTHLHNLSLLNPTESIVLNGSQKSKIIIIQENS